jgi:sigma-B regulation protein RsbU (phosphoserine phosphatase)
MLGVFEEATFEERRIELVPDERLLLYTDGVTEAVDPALEQFGDDRLLALPGGLFHSARALVEAVVATVEAFAGEAEQADDITVLVIRRATTAAHIYDHVLRGGIEGLPAVAAWLQQALDETGIDDDLAGELQLVAEEVLANVVHHAHRDRPDAEATVRLEVDDERVVMTFGDDGPPFDPLTEAPEPDLDLAPEARPIGGLGVLLCKRLADRIDYRREAERNVLRFERRRASG